MTEESGLNEGSSWLGSRGRDAKRVGGASVSFMCDMAGRGSERQTKRSGRGH